MGASVTIKLTRLSLIADRAVVISSASRCASRFVAGKNAPAQTVAGVVRHAEGVFGILDLNDRNDRSEGFFGQDVSWNDRRRPEPWARNNIPADWDCAVRRSTPLRLWRKLRRPGVSIFLSCASEVMQPTSTSFSLGPWRIACTRATILSTNCCIDRRLDIDALDGRAGLAAVHQRAPNAGAGGTIEIGVFENDHRIFATELQRNRNQTVRGAAHDLSCRSRRCR